MFFRKPSDHVPHVTIFHTILRSMLWILFIEIALLVGILYLCRINTNLEQNAVDILQIQTENRQNYLQGQMLDAQDLSSLAGKINAVTQAMLDDGEISLDTLDSGSDAASPLLLSIGDSLISSMRHRPVTGIFVVLNTHDLDTRKKGEPLPCLYLRDLDPNSSPSQRNSDLMLVRAPAQVVQSLYIATDTSWTPSRPTAAVAFSIPSFRQPTTETANWTPRTTATGRPRPTRSPATITPPSPTPSRLF